MACKVCGELCRCTEPEPEVSPRFSDLDPYDPSEEQFASSLGNTTNDEYEDEAELLASSTLAESLHRGRTLGHGDMTDIAIVADSTPAPIPQPDDATAWKQEVTSRLSRYKARRREQLGQSSLNFSFESTTGNHVFLRPEATAEALDTTDLASADTFDQQFLAPTNMGSVAPELEVSGTPALDTTGLFAQPTEVVDETPPSVPDVGKLIEFPRALYLGPAVNPYELAEPVLDAPRILDVPESIPAPPPPLSDIQLEPEGEEMDPQLLEPVLYVAPLPQRIFSGAVDAVVVLAAAALFGTIALKIAGPTLLADRRTILIATAVVPMVLWAIYNYLLLVHGGRTLGMILGRLRLVSFEHAPVRRNIRKFRVCALQLSCLALGMGLIWAFIDEDQICWHDRITHTYLSAC
jgi:RDD family